MDVFDALSSPRRGQMVKCIDMQTTGEPTRIIVSGYPDLNLTASPSPPTLLAQRDYARSNHDHLRRVLILEPRGHYDMYGALLRPHTELVTSGEADVGVLFMTNDGYSTMCGHATIALGRLLLDTLDTTIFPHRERVSIDEGEKVATLKLHAPCGVVVVRVPVQRRSTPIDSDNTNVTSSLDWKSDPTRPVLFDSTPSFATGVCVRIDIPLTFRWPELGDRTSVTVDFSYGGAFYCLVPAAELGFPSGLTPTAQALRSEAASSAPQVDFEPLNTATRLLKAAITTNPAYHQYFAHPTEKDLSFLYSIMVVDHVSPTTSHGTSDKVTYMSPHETSGQMEIETETKGSETGLCFFADQQLDRSPTGSAVAARIALAHARGTLGVGESWTYHSLLSRSQSQSQLTNPHDKNDGAFTGTLVQLLDDTYMSFPVVKVQVQGYAYYTGCQSFTMEEEDPLGWDGFVFGR